MKQRTIICTTVFSMVLCIVGIFVINIHRIRLPEVTNDVVKTSTYQPREEKKLATGDTVIKTWNVSTSIVGTLYQNGLLVLSGSGEIPGDKMGLSST